MRLLLLILFTVQYYRLSNTENDFLLDRTIRQAENQINYNQQFQPCLGPNSIKGRCRYAQACVLPEFKENPKKALDYLCIIQQKFVGICCPETYRGSVEKWNWNTNSEMKICTGEQPIETVSQLAQQFDRVVKLAQPRSLNTRGNPEEKSLPPPLFESNSCGINGKQAARIKEGQASEIKDWPWIAALKRPNERDNFCGGVLINQRWVLTAAHCVLFSGLKKATDLIIRLGEYDFSKFNETKFVDIPASVIKVHPRFSEQNYENDISLVQLSQKVTYNVFVRPICLPQPGEFYEGATAIVTGWGTLSYGGQKSDVLMEVPVPVWKLIDCRTKFSQNIFDTNLCAGGYKGGKDSCQGDSGGPLLFQRPDKKWTIIGVVSWGINCGITPGVYAQVNKYMPWIYKVAKVV